MDGTGCGIYRGCRRLLGDAEAAAFVLWGIPPDAFGMAEVASPLAFGTICGCCSGMETFGGEFLGPSLPKEGGAETGGGPLVVFGVS